VAVLAGNPLIFGGADHGTPPRPWSNVWEGWWPVLHALDARLRALDPRYGVDSVAEIDGRLAVGVTVAPAVRGAADAAIAEAVRAAGETCECCGAPGSLRVEPPGRWVKTLCDAHAAPDEVDAWTAAGRVAAA
jgi:hypothetical protein